MPVHIASYVDFDAVEFRNLLNILWIVSSSSLTKDMTYPLSSRIYVSFVDEEEELPKRFDSFLLEFVAIMNACLAIYFAKILSCKRLLKALCSIRITLKSSL